MGLGGREVEVVVSWKADLRQVAWREVDPSRTEISPLPAKSIQSTCDYITVLLAN